MQALTPNDSLNNMILGHFTPSDVNEELQRVIALADCGMDVVLSNLDTGGIYVLGKEKLVQVKLISNSTELT